MRLTAPADCSGITELQFFCRNFSVSKKMIGAPRKIPSSQLRQPETVSCGQADDGISALGNKLPEGLIDTGTQI